MLPLGSKDSLRVLVNADTLIRNSQMQTLWLGYPKATTWGWALDLVVANVKWLQTSIFHFHRDDLLKDIAWSAKDFYRIWKGIEVSNIFTLGLGPGTVDIIYPRDMDIKRI